jgi:hypothetical protein
MVDCSKCIHRGKPMGLSQDSYCSNCIHAEPWRRDHYDEGAVGGVPHHNCDGCARELPVVDGLHRQANRAVMVCTADRYT